MRSLLAWLLAAVTLAPAVGSGAVFVDAVLGSADARVVTASDIALARALGLFGFTPSAAPIGAADVDRMLDAVLVVREAELLGIGGGEDEAEAAWRAVVERTGGSAALERWLAEVGIEPARARALAVRDARWRRFIDLRFRDFAFVTPDEVAAALAGQPDPALPERVRARLRDEKAERQLAAWVQDNRARANLRRLVGDDARIPTPFPMP